MANQLKFIPFPDVYCSICAEHETLDVCIELSGCKHQYHRNCLLQWTAINNTCPYCRSIITSTQLSDDYTRNRKKNEFSYKCHSK